MVRGVACGDRALLERVARLVDRRISPAVAGSKPSEAMAVCTAASTLPDEKSAYFTRMFAESPASHGELPRPVEQQGGVGRGQAGDVAVHAGGPAASLTSSGSLMRSRLPLSSPERAPLSAMDQPDSANAALTPSALRPTSEARFGRLAMEAGRARFCSTVARARSAECVTVVDDVEQEDPADDGGGQDERGHGEHLGTGQPPAGG